MPVSISDQLLQQAGLTEREFLIEVACRFFDAERLTSFQASQLAGLSRLEFWDELKKRGIPVIRYTEEDFRQDLEGMKWLEAQRAGNQ